MSFVFDPKLLMTLDLEEILRNKSVTADPVRVENDYLLRPLKNDDYGMCIFRQGHSRIPDYLTLLEQLTVVGKVTQNEFRGEFDLSLLLSNQQDARNLWIVQTRTLS